MRIAVKDASILIDLVEGDLLGLWFQLQIETHTTDLVLHEVKQGDQWPKVSPFVDAGLLRTHASAAVELVAATTLSRAAGISLADASGILLAQRLGAILLTGDRRMRQAAGAEAVEARGLLWILDELLGRSVLASGDAATRLERMMQAGSRLPRAECEARLHRWRS